MKRIKLSFFILFLISATIAYSQLRLQSHTENDTLTGIIIDLGKRPSAMNFKVDNIDKKYITSALYVVLDNSKERTAILINDDVFNYDYYNKNIRPYQESKRVNIYVEKHFVNGKDVYVATRVE